MFWGLTGRYIKTRNHNSICDSLNQTILKLFNCNQKLKKQIQKQKEEIEELTLKLKNYDLQELQLFQDILVKSLPLTIADLN